MSDFLQGLAAKVPELAGAGILGVSLCGVGAVILGLSFPLEAEIAAAFVGVGAALLASRRR